MTQTDFYNEFKKAWFKLAPFTTTDKIEDCRACSITFVVRFFLNGEVEQMKETVTFEQLYGDTDLLKKLLKNLYLEFLDKLTSSVI